MLRNICISLVVIVQLAIASVIFYEPVSYEGEILEKIEEDISEELFENPEVENSYVSKAVDDTLDEENANVESEIEEPLTQEAKTQEDNTESENEETAVLIHNGGEVILPASCYYVAMLRFNIRKEPDINSEIIGKIPSGNFFNILEIANNDWCAVEFNGIYGFCNTEIIRQCGSFSE